MPHGTAHKPNANANRRTNSSFEFGNAALRKKSTLPKFTTFLPISFPCEFHSLQSEATSVSLWSQCVMFAGYTIAV